MANLLGLRYVEESSIVMDQHVQLDGTVEMVPRMDDSGVPVVHVSEVGRTQLVWFLANPVRFFDDDGAPTKSYLFLQRIRDTLIPVLGADAQFTHGLSRNPLYRGAPYVWHKMHDRPWELPELAEATEELGHPVPKPWEVTWSSTSFHGSITELPTRYREQDGSEPESRNTWAYYRLTELTIARQESGQVITMAWLDVTLRQLNTEVIGPQSSKGAMPDDHSECRGLDRHPVDHRFRDAPARTSGPGGPSRGQFRWVHLHPGATQSRRQEAGSAGVVQGGPNEGHQERVGQVDRGIGQSPRRAADEQHREGRRQSHRRGNPPTDRGAPGGQPRDGQEVSQRGPGPRTPLRRLSSTMRGDPRGLGEQPLRAYPSVYLALRTPPPEPSRSHGPPWDDASGDSLSVDLSASRETDDETLDQNVTDAQRGPGTSPEASRARSRPRPILKT